VFDSAVKNFAVLCEKPLYEKSEQIEDFINIQIEMFHDYKKFGKEKYQLGAEDTQTLLERFRTTALQCVNFQQFMQAEEIYLFLLEQQFQSAGTLCHLGRLYFLMGKGDKARNHIKKL
jgi:hypothetical protein